MNEHDERNLRRIVQFAGELQSMLKARDISPEDIREDTFVQWAVTTPLYNIGEYTSHVSKELKAQHPEIPWSRVSGLRHRLVHDYERTNWEIIIHVIYCDLPDYIAQLHQLIL